MTDQILAVQKMQDYIEAHLTEEITLATLCKCWNPTTSETPDARCQGFHFVCFTLRKGRFCFVRQKDALKVSAGYVTICM